jgi:hypothetical protein
MLIIGLILFGAAVAVGIDVAVINDAGVDVDAFGQMFSTTIGGAFVAGIVTAIVGCLGLLMISDGTARRRRLAHEAKAARMDRVEHAERENVDLRDRPVTREVGPDEEMERPRHRLLHRSSN